MLFGLLACWCLIDGVGPLPALGYQGEPPRHGPSTLTSRVAGYAAAVVLTMGFECCVFVFYTFVWRRAHLIHKTWSGLSLNAYSLENIKHFSSLGVPLVVEQGAAAGADVLLTLATARLGAGAVAALAVLHTLRGLAQSLFIGAAVQVRIGVLMVQNQAHARRVLWATFGSFMCMSMLVGCMLYALRERVVAIYSTDPHVAATMSQNFGLMLIDYVLCVGAGCLKNGLVGLSANKRVAIAEAVSMWIVKVPVALYLMWLVGLRGNLLGHIAGDLFRLGALCWFVFTVDWSKQCELAHERSS